jgi:hypothetical protein
MTPAFAKRIWELLQDQNRRLYHAARDRDRLLAENRRLKARIAEIQATHVYNNQR